MFDTIQLLKSSIVRQGETVPDKVAARPVDPTRVSLPEEAAIFDPASVLPAELVKCFEHADNIVLPRAEWPAVVPKPCHWISKDRERLLRKRLLEIELAEPIVVCDVALDPSGRPSRAGLFAVVHKPASDRMIVDRRNANCLERRLGWCSLPHGCQLSFVRLAPGECLRGSGDELSNYFWLL